MTSQNHQPEPVVSLPTAAMLAVGILVPLLAGGTWWLAATLGPWTAAAALAGLAGAAATAVATIVSTLVIGPWHERPVSLWMSIWLGGTVVRLLLTPALAFLLYSAAPLSPTALAGSVGITYLVTLLSEVAVIARHLRRVMPT
jgi:hypothetical protein